MELEWSWEGISTSHDFELGLGEMVTCTGQFIGNGGKKEFR